MFKKWFAKKELNELECVKSAYDTLVQDSMREIGVLEKKVKDLEIHIHNFKSSSKDQNEDILKHKESIKSIQHRNQELIGEINEKDNVINQLKTELSSESRFKEKNSLTHKITLLEKELSLLKEMDESVQIKELKRRNGIQSDTIHKLNFEISELKIK